MENGERRPQAAVQQRRGREPAVERYPFPFLKAYSANVAEPSTLGSS